MSKRKIAIRLFPWVLLVLSWAWFFQPLWMRGVFAGFGFGSRVEFLRPPGRVEGMDIGVLFHSPYEKLFETATAILMDLNLVIRERHQDFHYIVAERVTGDKNKSGAEAVGLYFSPEGPMKTTVMVMTLVKVFRKDARNWTKIIYQKLSQRVGCRIPRDFSKHWNYLLKWKKTKCE